MAQYLTILEPSTGNARRRARWFLLQYFLSCIGWRSNRTLTLWSTMQQFNINEDLFSISFFFHIFMLYLCSLNLCILIFIYIFIIFKYFYLNFILLLCFYLYYLYLLFFYICKDIWNSRNSFPFVYAYKFVFLQNHCFLT